MVYEAVWTKDGLYDAYRTDSTDEVGLYYSCVLYYKYIQLLLVFY
ncbi:hypothetical protein PALU110988_09105 [Paenibacillus lupini]|nr:hypothetical protein [Paenibacillus lupini]